VVPAWRRHAIPLLVLWGLALLAYSNSFRGGLIFDNYFVIGQDPRIHQATAENAGLILTRDYWYGTTVSPLYRPLTTFSYLFNYAILGNGAAPAGYHWVNFILHAVNVALVYLLGWLLMAEFWPAFAMAAIWSLHPLLTESVTNIVGRADLLSAFGVLGGLLCYARAVTVRRHAIGWQLALLAASTIAVFSKESGVVIVAAVFLYDIGWHRDSPWAARVKGYVAACLPAVAFLLLRLYLLAGRAVPIIAFTDNPLTGADFWTARITAIKVLGKYLWLWLWPARLSADYSYNQIPLFSWNLARWEDWKAVVAVLVLAGLGAIALVAYRRLKPIYFWIGLFFIAIAPTSNLFILIGTIMAERLLYLPSVALAGCLASTGWAVYRKLRTRWPAARLATRCALALICLAFCGRTFERNFDWFDEQTLWSSAVMAVPAAYRPHKNLANTLAFPPFKDLAAADREIDRALAILQPLPYEERPAEAYAVAGECYRLTGDAQGEGRGVDWYRKALAVLLEGKKADDALDRVLGRENRLAGKKAGHVVLVSLYLELGRTYRALGEFQNALDSFTAVREVDMEAGPIEEIASTYEAMGDAPQAAVSLLEGIAMGVRDRARLLAEVTELYRQAAPRSCALTGPQGPAALNAECPLVRDQLCTASGNVAALYRRSGREHDALAIASNATRSLGCAAGTFR
jgi:tetratricopeptide (TPR) repeat protein